MGRIAFVGDGIVHVAGCGSARVGEILLISNSIRALVFDLGPKYFSAAVFDEWELIKTGMSVGKTGKPFSIAPGFHIIGRVVNLFCEIITFVKTKTEVTSSRHLVERFRVEIKAPGVFARNPICESFCTGIKIVDLLFPVGRGQRELVLGDRATGKTAICIDAALNQNTLRNRVVSAGHAITFPSYVFSLYNYFNIAETVCMYVCIGQRRSALVNVLSTLVKRGAIAYTTIPASTASETAVLQYLLPYCAATAAEWLRSYGIHVFMIFDDLTRHADAYRQVSLLLKRPPSREAFPADIFYLHSRLLERASKIKKTTMFDFLYNSQCAITAFPVIEIYGGDLTTYISTNIISITDGQLVLQSELFHSGIKPAINIGLSVSRIGSAAQPAVIRRVIGSLRLELMQFKEIESFARFEADLGKHARFLIRRGFRLVEFFKQKRFEFRTVHEQLLGIIFLINGHFDGLPREDVSCGERKLLDTILPAKTLVPLFLQIESFPQAVNFNYFRYFKAH